VWSVLVAPTRTFQSIAERPTWLPPLLCLVLAAGAFVLVATPKLDYGETIREALEGRNITLEDTAVDSQIAIMERFGWAFALLGVVVFQPAGFLLIALLFWIVFKLLGSDMRFPTGLSVTVHGLLPLAVAALVSLPVALGRDSLTAEELQSGLLLSNLGFLAGEDAPAWLAAALRCIDFFSLWILALYVLGFRIATRLPAGTVTVTAVVLWIAWCGVKVGFSALSAMFG
jgi:hypothetical protein